MKQFCPKCCQWYDIDSPFCPNCEVIMYNEEECIQKTNDKNPIEIISKKKFENMFTTGAFMLSLGIVVSFAGFLIKELFLEIFVILLLVGLFCVIFGLIQISQYNSLKYKISIVKNSQQPKPIILCPYCRSNDTIKIQSLDRMGSVVLTGLASSKIGKQWHCNNCDSDF